VQEPSPTLVLEGGFVAEGSLSNTTIITIQTEPPFQLAIPSMTNPCQNAITSAAFNGVFAPIETRIYMSILSSRCKKLLPNGKPPLVVDVGGNVGYFTVYAAKMGCRVISAEPLSENLQFLTESLKLNQIESLVTIKQLAVGAKKGSAKMVQDCVDTGFSLILEGDEATIPVQVDTLQSIVNEDVLLLKIDTEGYEDEVFGGMGDLLNHYKIEYIVCEFKFSRDIEAKVKTINSLMKDYHTYTYDEDYSYFLEPESKGLQLLRTKITDWKEIGVQLNESVTKHVWLPYEDLLFERKSI